MHRELPQVPFPGLKDKAHAKLAGTVVAGDAGNGTEGGLIASRRPNSRADTAAAIDVVEVPVEEIVELNSKRKLILPVGAHGETLQQAGAFALPTRTAQLARFTSAILSVVGSAFTPANLYWLCDISGYDTFTKETLSWMPFTNIPAGIAPGS